MKSVVSLILFAAFAQTGVSSALHAQDSTNRYQFSATTGLDLGTVEVDRYERTSVLSAGQMLSVTGPNTIVRARVVGSRFSSGRMSGYGDLYGGYHFGTFSNVALFTEAEAGAGAYRGRMSGYFFQSGVRLGIGSSIIGKLHVARAYDTLAYTAASGAIDIPLHYGGVSMLSTVRLTYAHSRPFAQAGVGLAYDSRFIRLGAQAGAATAPDRNAMTAMRAFGSVYAAVPITSVIALSFSAGQFPPDLLRAFPAARHLSAGIRFSWPPQRTKGGVILAIRPREVWVRRATPNAPSCLMIRLPNATTIEIRGSFTSWEAVAMTKDSDGNWCLPVTLTTGVHPVAIRVDGGSWRSPPGLTKAQDEFGQEHGLLVVE